MDEKKAKEINIKLQSVLLSDFHVEKDIDTKDLVPANYNYDFTINFNISKSEAKIETTLTVVICADKTQSKKIGKIVATGTYLLKELDEILNQQKGIPNDILTIFMGSLISTTRGMLLIKSKGTILEGAIIPLINPATFFKPSTEKK